MSLLDLPTDILMYEIIKWFRTSRELYNYMILCKETHHIVKKGSYECNILFAVTLDGIRGINPLKNPVFANDEGILPIKVTENFMQLLMFSKSYANYIGPNSVRIFNTDIPRRLFSWSPNDVDVVVENVTRVVSFDFDSYTVSSLDTSVSNAIAYFRDGKKSKTKIDMSCLSLDELEKSVGTVYINRFIVRKNLRSLDAMLAIESNPDIGNFCCPMGYGSYCTFTLSDIDDGDDPILVSFRDMLRCRVMDIVLPKAVHHTRKFTYTGFLVGSQLLRLLGNENIPIDSDYDIATYGIGRLDGIARSESGAEIINDKHVRIKYEGGTCDMFVPDLPIDMLVKSFHFPCVHMFLDLGGLYSPGIGNSMSLGLHLLPSAVIPIMTRQMAMSSIRISANMPLNRREDLIEKYKRYGYTFVDTS